MTPGSSDDCRVSFFIEGGDLCAECADYRLTGKFSCEIKTAPRRIAALKRACSLSSLHSLSDPMPAAIGN